MTPEEQFIEAQDIIVDTITNKLTHQYYKRVTDYADKLKKLITGEDIDTLLKKFVRREDDVMFKQRCDLTHAITPAVSASLMTPFYKVGRSNNIILKIDFEGSKDNTFEDKKKEVLDAEMKYNGDKSLHRYLETRLVELNFSDPNSFIVTEFDEVPHGPQGQLLEKVDPRPFEVSSHEAINYFYKNNILQWLIVRQDCIYYDDKDVSQKGYSYTIYYPDIAIKFTQVNLNDDRMAIGQTIKLEVEGEFYTYMRIDKERVFQIENFAYNAGRVPAVRVGYKLDIGTNGATMVSPMHDALCYFMKSIKTVSEFDLTMALHAFPQKFQYVNRCLGGNNLGCNNGTTNDGGTCSKCNGTGFALHSSAQDAVVMRIPKDKDELINLEQLVHYEYPPIDLLKFQDDFISELEQKAIRAVFHQKDISQSTGTKTATEMDYAYEDVYDTLFPFAENFSKVYKDILTVIAKFRDISDIIIIHRFPKDFKFKSTDELLNELKLATESGAPGYIRQELSVDIASQQYTDKPEELNRILTKQRFFPFPDKTPTEINFIISSDLTTKYNKILYANFDNIFFKLEKDAEEKQLYFYDYTQALQQELLTKAVNDMIAEIGGEQTIAATFIDSNASV